MEYYSRDTEFLENEYKRLLDTNIAEISDDIVETIAYNIREIGAILYNRQQDHINLT